jgi:hypothetical protein
MAISIRIVFRRYLPCFLRLVTRASRFGPDVDHPTSVIHRGSVPVAIGAGDGAGVLHRSADLLRLAPIRMHVEAVEVRGP